MPISPQQLDAVIEKKYNIEDFIRLIDNQLVSRCGSFGVDEPAIVSTAWMPAQVAQRIQDAYVAAGWGDVVVAYETGQHDAGTTFTLYRRKQQSVGRNCFDEPNGVER